MQYAPHEWSGFPLFSPSQLFFLLFGNDFSLSILRSYEIHIEVDASFFFVSYILFMRSTASWNFQRSFVSFYYDYYRYSDFCIALFDVHIQRLTSKSGANLFLCLFVLVWFFFLCFKCSWKKNMLECKETKKSRSRSTQVHSCVWICMNRSFLRLSFCS